MAVTHALAEGFDPVIGGSPRAPTITVPLSSTENSLMTPWLDFIARCRTCVSNVEAADCLVSKAPDNLVEARVEGFLAQSRHLHGGKNVLEYLPPLMCVLMSRTSKTMGEVLSTIVHVGILFVRLLVPRRGTGTGK